MKSRVALVVSAVCSLSAPVQGQALFPSESPISDAEAEGRSLPAPERFPSLDEWMADEFEYVGTESRTCSEVPFEEWVIARSGEMFVGGGLGRPLVDGRLKLWWKPAVSALQMSLVVKGQLLGSSETISFTSEQVSAPYTNDRPPRRIPEEAFFPGLVEFSSPGRWILVGRSGLNWGCFLLDVPEWRDPDR